MLGGAFNPPHIGHLVFAREAAHQLGLDEVLLVPTGEAPHRRIEPEPGRDVRFELTVRAAASDELLRASDLEVAREGPSYTYRTLEILREQRPDVEPWLLMGADVAAGIEQWRRPERVVELARVGVAARPGTAIDEAEAALEQFGAEGRSELVRMPELAISSTRIRRRIADGRPIRYLVPDLVAELIRARGLYRQREGAVA